MTRVVIDMLAAQYGEHDSATVLAHPGRSSALAAALANGVMTHACDLDDVSETMCGHPTAPALPAILAAGELVASSGRDVLVAYAAAIEVMTKLGRAAGYELSQCRWHVTATLGVFGAAVGASKMLGLDAEQIATAIGIAASRAAGIRANAGTMVKPMHCGFAARDGLEPHLPHDCCSVTKSFTGTLVAAFVHEGVLDDSKLIPHYLPELRGTGWEDATLRQVMDMQTGIAFTDLEEHPDVLAYHRASGWRPAQRTMPGRGSCATTCPR